MTEDSIRALIADHLAVPVDRVVPDAAFAEDLGADSLDLIALTMRIEEALDLCVSEPEAENCRTVGEALALIKVKSFFRQQVGQSARH